MTITDADLERLLTLAASEYAVPEDGVATVLAAERAPAPPKVRTRPAWFAQRRLAIGVAVLAVLGIFIGGVVTSGPSKHTSSAASGVSAQRAAANGTGPASMPTVNASAVPEAAGPDTFAQGTIGGTTASGTGGKLAPPGAVAPAVTAPEPMASAAAAPTEAALGALSGTSAGGAASAADAGISDSAKIVRTGQADLTVAKGSVPAAQGKLEGLATALGGYVASEQTNGGDAPSATITLRVPGDRFAALVTQVQQIGKVAELSTQAADVTAQYTDLSARIHALETQRDTYLTLLAKATSIQETLAVQQRVDSVQTQLEQLQGQQKVLDDQTSYGSLSVTVTQEGQAVITTLPKPRTGFAKAWYDAKHRFNGGVQGLVAASGPIAFIALLALTAWVLWLLVRRRWQRARV